ncbi:hypothetical protein ACQUFY_14675 [Robbsia andropogonis]|uniref:hypothetical protein n=1 Tax=Robbsia andropogonis TaxID=28092 RepID=UPI003D20A762
MKEAQNSKADNEKIASKPLSYGQSSDATVMPNEMPSRNLFKGRTPFTHLPCAMEQIQFTSMDQPARRRMVRDGCWVLRGRYLMQASAAICGREALSPSR